MSSSSSSSSMEFDHSRLDPVSKRSRTSAPDQPFGLEEEKSFTQPDLASSKCIVSLALPIINSALEEWKKLESKVNKTKKAITTLTKQRSEARLPKSLTINVKIHLPEIAEMKDFNDRIDKVHRDAEVATLNLIIDAQTATLTKFSQDLDSLPSTFLAKLQEFIVGPDSGARLPLIGDPDQANSTKRHALSTSQDLLFSKLNVLILTHTSSAYTTAVAEEKRKQDLSEGKDIALADPQPAIKDCIAKEVSKQLATAQRPNNLTQKPSRTKPLKKDQAHQKSPGGASSHGNPKKKVSFKKKKHTQQSAKKSSKKDSSKGKQHTSPGGSLKKHGKPTHIRRISSHVRRKSN